MSQAISVGHLNCAYGWASDLHLISVLMFALRGGHVSTLGIPGCLAEASKEKSTLRFKSCSPKTHAPRRPAEMKATDPAPRPAVA